MWRCTGSDESITNQSGKQKSPPSCCTLCIFYPSHFPYSHFLHSHFPHSAFFTLIRFQIPHFLHSSFLHSATSALRAPSISPNPLLATIFFIKVCSAPKLTTGNEEKLSFRTCWESSWNLRANKHYIEKRFCLVPKARSGACTAACRLSSRSIVVAVLPEQRKFAPPGKFQRSFPICPCSFYVLGLH